jgi:hypothetical protein
MKKENKIYFKSIASNLHPRVVKRCQTLPAHIYLALYGAYGVPAMAWDGKLKPFLFDMSVPQFFIRAPCALTGASDFEEGATTESMQKTDGMLPSPRPIPAKKRVIPVLKLKDPVQVPNICEKEVF